MSTVLLAAQEIEWKPAGWVALFIVLGLCAGLFFLMRSMNRQLKKVDFDEDATERRQQPSGDERSSDDA
ncbi:hypothetical protein CLV56_1017 [Mumia flava]|uniref:Uncharacterized protein n=1 Tax=Mumia flava TaxID=1348852 RepID=A0A0B2B7Z2_9ACTN|nr:hypothetical protein [Mumia flava]PJJ56804.1 hypothetical protein CLV56_1017 [Mumia flava]